MSYKNKEEFYQSLKEKFAKLEKHLKKSERVKRTLTIPKYIDDLMFAVLGRLMILGKKVNYSDLISILAFFGLQAQADNVFDDLQSDMELTMVYRQFGNYLEKAFEE